MLVRNVNGYTEAEVTQAFQGFGLPLQRRNRAELLDLDNTLLFRLDGLLEQGGITHDTQQPLKRGADLRFLQKARDSQHSAPLATFALTVAAQSRLFWLRLGETSGNFADSSGNSRTFTASGGITYSVGSLTAGDATNNAITLNGTTGFLSIAHATWMNVTRLTLVIAWRGTGVFQTLIDRDDGSTSFWRLELDGSGNPSLQMGFTTGSYTTYAASAAVNDNQPHLIHCTYDGSFVSIYVDGKRLVHTAETRTMKTTGTMGIRIGVNNVPSRFSSGTFDEGGMLGRALAPREIRDEYQAWSNQLNEILIDKNRGDRVKIYCGIVMPTAGTDGTFVAEWPQIVAVMTSPQEEYDDNKLTVQVSCQDQTRILQDVTFEAVTTLISGANYITGTNGIQSLATAAGFDTSSWAITSTTLTAPADVPFEIGSTYLDAINYLLTSINYKPIRFNGDGAGILEPNKLDIDLPLSDTLDTATNSVIGAERLSRRLEPRKVINQVIVPNGNPDVIPIRGVATNTNATSPSSTIYNAAKIAVFQIDSPDSTTANATALQLLSDLTARSAERIVFETLPRPIHDDRDRLRLIISELDIDTDYVEESWSLPLDATQMMQHTFLSVVDVG